MTWTGRTSLNTQGIVFVFLSNCLKFRVCNHDMAFALEKNSNGGIKHGTIIRTGITCKKILLQKFIEFGIPLK